MFYREKKTDCGAYREADIIPRTDNAARAVKGKRGKKRKATEPKQKVKNTFSPSRHRIPLTISKEIPTTASFWIPITTETD